MTPHPHGKARLIREYLLASPHQTQRQVAQALGVSPGTVYRVRKPMEQSGALVSHARSREGQTRPSDRGEYVRSLDALLADRRRFGTLLIDPPWPYTNQATQGATSRHYQSMTMDALKALPVDALAADDAHLHLWATNAFLPEALSLVQTWGFTFKGLLVWIKPSMGLGNYWRVSHELLLLGIRGQAPFRSRSQMSWVRCRRGAHSAKPEQIRQMIERVSPPPYLELFGRHQIDRWTVYGDQLEPTLFNLCDTEPV